MEIGGKKKSWINGGKLNYWQMLTHMKGELFAENIEHEIIEEQTEIHFDNLSKRLPALTFSVHSYDCWYLSK